MRGQWLIMLQHVYIIGAKGISFYGGFESFIQKLLEYHKDNAEIQYHVACKANGEGHMDVSKLNTFSSTHGNRLRYCNADCIFIHVPEWMGSAQAIAYDIKALKECCKAIKKSGIPNAIVYILGCRIGPFINKYVKKIHQMGGRVYLNPDGHEWKRSKWSAAIQLYWKKSEALMIKHSDLIICDSKSIENYVRKEYKQYNPKTVFIAYGAETRSSHSPASNLKYEKWLKKHNIKDYYIMISRCVPENNYETIIGEFMKSHTVKDLIIISTENKKFMNILEEKLHFKRDKRIKFIGTIYDQELLTQIRENAFGYLHGHSVGGTNPSLLEALGSTKLNLLYDIEFNREVAGNSAMYWSIKKGDLSALIDQTDQLSEPECNEYGIKAKKRIRENYSWELITNKYLDIFLAHKNINKI